MEYSNADIEEGPRGGATVEMSVLLEKGTGGDLGKLCTPPPGDDVAAGCCKRFRQGLRRYLFLWLNTLGVVVGFAFAFGLRHVDVSKNALMWLGLPGELFLRLLKITIVPLIVANVIAGSASVDPASNGRAGLVVLIYTVVCNFIGAGLGLLLGFFAKPGESVVIENIALKKKASTNVIGTQDIFVDLIRNLVPDNLVRATMQKVQTTLTSSETTTGNLTDVSYVKHVDYVQDINILGLLFFCVVFGVAVGLNKEKSRPIREFFSACTDVMLTVLGWFIWVSPLGVCSLIMVAILEVPELETVLIKVAIFFTIVIGGVLFQEIVFYPCLYFAVFRRNPFPVLLSSARAWAIAFASSSSSCTMPEMFRVTSTLGCDTNLTSLTVPVSVTLNATGSGLFIAAAVLFLAQVSQVPLSAGQYGIIWMLTSLSSMVLPSVPSASIVTVVMILTTLSIPSLNMGLLFTVEWLLDRIRTTGNVVSEIYGILIIDYYCKAKVKVIKGASLAV